MLSIYFTSFLFFFFGLLLLFSPLAPHLSQSFFWPGIFAFKTFLFRFFFCAPVLFLPFPEGPAAHAAQSQIQIPNPKSKSQIRRRHPEHPQQFPLFPLWGIPSLRNSGRARTRPRPAALGRGWDPWDGGVDSQWEWEWE